MKNLVRVMALDDGCFKPRKKGKTILVGVVARLDNRVEGIATTTVKVDGLDSTAQIIQMVKKSKFRPQVKFLILDGINFAGFNIVDLPKLSEKLGIPAIAVQRKKPRMQKIEKALLKFKDRKKRMQLIEKAGEITKAKKVFFQCCGTDRKTVKDILSRTSKHSNIPEALRLAHLIASGTTTGESTRP